MAEFFMMPAASPTMEVGRLANLICAEGDPVEFGTVVAEVETDKATAEIESFDDGVLLKILQPAGSDVAVGTPIAIIGEEDDDISDLLPIESGATDATSSPGRDCYTSSRAKPNSGPVKAGPGARDSDASGVSLSSVKGTGPNGRVLSSHIWLNHRVLQRLKIILGMVSLSIVLLWKCQSHSHRVRTIQNVKILAQVLVVVL